MVKESRLCDIYRQNRIDKHMYDHNLEAFQEIGGVSIA